MGYLPIRTTENTIAAVYAILLQFGIGIKFRVNLESPSYRNLVEMDMSSLESFNPSVIFRL